MKKLSKLLVIAIVLLSVTGCGIEKLKEISYKGDLFVAKQDEVTKLVEV